MNPATLIAVLDRAVADYGEAVVLRRASVDIAARAVVRGYLADEIGGGVVQGDRRLVLSPTGLPPDRLPRVGDKAIIAGRVCAAMSVDLIRAAGEIVRIEIQVRG